MPQGLPSLPATQQVSADICGGVGFQKVVRVRPAEFIRPKEAMIWLFEWMKGSASLWGGYVRGKWHFPRVTQLGLSNILPGAWSQLGGVAGSCRMCLNDILWRGGRCWSGLDESEWSEPLLRAAQLSLSQILPRSWQGLLGIKMSGPCPKATWLSQWHFLSLLRPLHSSPGSILLSRESTLQCWTTQCPESGAIVPTPPQANTISRGMLHPRRRVL